MDRRLIKVDVNGGAVKVYYYHTDHHGTPLFMTDTSGQKVWSAVLLKAEQCSLLSDTVAFLDLVRIKSNNAEFNEFFSKVIERIATRETKCLLNALVKMDKASQKLIMRKLRNPLFLESAAIEKALKNAQNDKFKFAVDMYFQSDK